MAAVAPGRRRRLSLPPVPFLSHLLPSPLCLNPSLVLSSSPSMLPPPPGPFPAAGGQIRPSGGRICSSHGWICWPRVGPFPSPALVSFSASRRRLLNLPSFHVAHHHSGCLGCFVWRMLWRLADRGCSRTDALPSRSLFRRMLCRQGRTSWVDALPPGGCLAAVVLLVLALSGCFAAQVVIGGCFATVSLGRMLCRHI